MTPTTRTKYSPRSKDHRYQAALNTYATHARQALGHYNKAVADDLTDFEVAAALEDSPRAQRATDAMTKQIIGPDEWRYFRNLHARLIKRHIGRLNV